MEDHLSFPAADADVVVAGIVIETAAAPGVAAAVAALGVVPARCPWSLNLCHLAQILGIERCCWQLHPFEQLSAVELLQTSEQKQCAAVADVED